jgi:hypothetical protein
MSLAAFSSFAFARKQPVEPSTISNLTSNNRGELTLNPTSYTAPGHTVYQIINNNGYTGSTSSGSFKFNVKSNITVHIICIGGGGSGGYSYTRGSSPNPNTNGGGGGSAGEFVYRTMNLTTGTYNCSFVVGAGSIGVPFTLGTDTYVSAENGYGRPGNMSSITINGNRIEAMGGSPGGPASFDNKSDYVGAYGGGAGATRPTSIRGSLGDVINVDGIHFSGGTTESNSPSSGGGSPMGNGLASDRIVLNTQYNVMYGGLGGQPIGSNHSSLYASPFALFSTTQYFCEGGHGATEMFRSGTGGVNIRGTTSLFGLSGRSSGVFISSNTQPTGIHFPLQPTNHTGSGGCGCARFGLQTTGYSPNGSNGLILIAFSNS